MIIQDISAIQFKDEYRQLKALPPQYQIQREKEAIFNDLQLRAFLLDAEIPEIDQIENQHSYLVSTDRFEMQVDVVYIPRNDHWVGPANFSLTFHEPIWKNG